LHFNLKSAFPKKYSIALRSKGYVYISLFFVCLLFYVVVVVVVAAAAAVVVVVFCVLIYVDCNCNLQC
jgi:hypothetical protein